MTTKTMRNELIKRVPEMESEIKSASEVAVEIAFKLSKYSSKTRNAFKEELVREQTRRKIVKMIDNTPFFIGNEIERAETKLAMDHIIDLCEGSSVYAMLDIMYKFGKARGIREERQKKKAHLTGVR